MPLFKNGSIIAQNQMDKSNRKIAPETNYSLTNVTKLQVLTSKGKSSGSPRPMTPIGDRVLVTTSERNKRSTAPETTSTVNVNRGTIVKQRPLIAG